MYNSNFWCDLCCKKTRSVIREFVECAENDSLKVKEAIYNGSNKYQVSLFTIINNGRKWNLVLMQVLEKQ